VDSLLSIHDSWTLLLFVGAGVIAFSVFVAGCSDDPILGPDDGTPDDSGGSYSTIKRLAPADSSQPPDSGEEVVPSNPERF